MNEGFAKALRRQARAQGLATTAPGRGTVIPGRETKALWSSLNHKQRGQWRAKLPPTRAAARAALAYFIRQFAEYPRDYVEDMVDVVVTGRMSYNNAPRSR